MTVCIFCARLFLAFIIFGTTLHAESSRIAYHVINKMQGDEKGRLVSKEIWETQELPSGILQTRKIPQARNGEITTEDNVSTDFWWIQQTQLGSSPIILSQFLTVAPESMSPGQTTYGYIEVMKYDGQDYKVVETRPVFIAVYNVFSYRKIWQMKLEAYLPGGGKMEIIREYEPDSYFTPIIEQIKRFEPVEVQNSFPKLVLIDHVVSERQR